MKIGMTSLTFRDKGIETVIANAVSAGIAGIEWGVSEGHMPLCDKERAEKIKRLSKKNGIEIFSLGSYCKMTDRVDCDKVEFVKDACVESLIDDVNVLKRVLY